MDQGQIAVALLKRFIAIGIIRAHDLLEDELSHTCKIIAVPYDEARQLIDSFTQLAVLPAPSKIVLFTDDDSFMTMRMREGAVATESMIGHVQWLHTPNYNVVFRVRNPARAAAWSRLLGCQIAATTEPLPSLSEGSVIIYGYSHKLENYFNSAMRHVILEGE